jgi:hypothetical protein
MRKGIGRLWRLADGLAHLIGWGVVLAAAAGWATGMLEVHLMAEWARPLEWGDWPYLTAWLAAALLIAVFGPTVCWNVGFWWRTRAAGKGDR